MAAKVRKEVVKQLIEDLRAGVPADGLNPDATAEEKAAAVKVDDKRLEDGRSEKRVIGTE